MAKAPISPAVVALTTTEKATKALLAAATTLSKVNTELGDSIQQNEVVLEQIADGQARLDNLGTATVLAVRNQAIDLELRVRENEQTVLSTLMRKDGLAVITLVDLCTLNAELESAKVDNTVTVEKAVAIAVRSAQSVAESELLASTAKHDIETATLIAGSAAKDTEISFLKRSVETLERSAAAEREARVTMADSASKAAGVVVNTSGK